MTIELISALAIESIDENATVLLMIMVLYKSIRSDISLPCQRIFGIP